MYSAALRTACFLLPVLLLAAVALIIAEVAHTSDRTTDAGFWSFVTRPDIKAAKWDITSWPHEDAALAPGYWFLAPYRGHFAEEIVPDGGWEGPHIYDQDGSLIWSSTPLVEAGRIGAVEAFTLSQVNWGQGSGVEGMLTAMDLRTSRAVMINNHYEMSRTEDASGPGAYNTHELNFVDDGTRALAVYTHFHHNSSEAESRLVHFEGECHSICNGFVEYSVDPWEPLFTWSSCEGEYGAGFIALDESTMNDEEWVQKQCREQWDYVHMNSVDKTDDGDFILSARHADALYKISSIDGSIIWRLGGSRSDFVHVDDFKISRQHHVRVHGGNGTHTTLSILDNAKGPKEYMYAPSYAFSRGIVMVLDEASTPMTAQIIAQYDHPLGPGNYAHRRGGCQLLPNGNVFMGWSEQAMQSEHAADGTLLMHARLQPDWLGTYRAFKFDTWVGFPTDPPDVVVRMVRPSKTNDYPGIEAFVSWNGATEVAKWQLYQTNEAGHNRKLIATVPKRGFESRLSYDGYPRYVVVEALARNNSVLSSSKILEILAYEETEEDVSSYSVTVLAILCSPIFVAAFIVTVTGTALAAALWAFRARFDGARGRLGDQFRGRRYARLSSGESEGADGSQPLMKNEADWGEGPDIILDDLHDSSGQERVDR